jgi:CRISPR-associated protein Csx10
VSDHLEFEIEFKSDFHIGAGHGLGLLVDSALLRDPDGVPVLRGTVLAGLLRESLADLLAMGGLAATQQRCAASGRSAARAYCGQWAADEAPCPVCAIFGSPRQAKRWHISSARPVGLAGPQAIEKPWHAGQTAARLATRVRVNPRTRRAEKNKLFTREEGDGGLRFRFTADCRASDSTTPTEAAWLVAAARLCRSIGAGKYRGRGECEIHLVDREREESLLAEFETSLAHPQPPVAARPLGAEPPRPFDLPAELDQLAYVVRVLLRTDEPLLLARRAQAGNEFETLEVIPGAVLRGALAWRVAQRAGVLVEGDASYANFVNLFFRDALRFATLLPVRPQSEDLGYATMPAPRDLLTCELHPGYANRADEGHGVWGLAWDDQPLDRCPVCQEAGLDVKLQGVSAFLPLQRNRLTTQYHPRKTTEMHIRMEPHTGRVQTGDLFGYVLIEPGQYFAGEVSCANRAAWDALKEAGGLQSEGKVEELRLGKANRRGYGKVSLVFEAASRAAGQPGDISQRAPDPGKIVMTLLSEAIVVDTWGRFQSGFETGWLSRELNLPPDAAIAIADGAGFGRQFSAVRAVDAFNARLGLPRSRDLALAAGSSVRLSFDGIAGDELWKLLTAAEARGIGLRRDEGFGRVAFNHPIYTGCANSAISALDLGALELGRQAQEHQAARIDIFTQEWAKLLDERLGDRSKLFEDGRFEAVARLEHVSRAASQVDAWAALRELGRPDQLLVHPAHGSDKKNFYQDDGKAGVELVHEMLRRLEEKISEQAAGDGDLRGRMWRTGLRMLADRIAEPARRKGQGRK